MKPRRLLLLSGVLVVGGCLWPVRQATDHNVDTYAGHPFDLTPDTERAPAGSPQRPTDATPPAVPNKRAAADPPCTDVQTAAFMQTDDKSPRPGTAKPLDLNIPAEIPGSEAPLLKLPMDPDAKEEAIRKLFPELPALPEEPKPLPGPVGLPYSLADLQRLGAENSPALRQAAAGVEAARGNLIQAGAYQNPNISLQQQPNNDNTTGGFYGVTLDQNIKTAGKLRLAMAAAQKDLDNAELALKRARTDLATQIRGAYFSLLVARETVRVNRALARFTDEIYRLQARLASGGFGAAYEPAVLRAQAFMPRLAYQQSLANYAYAWKQLVATVNLAQMPLSEVSGRIDRLIPVYDYDTFLADVLSRHTDVLTARNGIAKARYNLQLAQVTPIPDIDFQIGVFKEMTLPPFALCPTASVTMPLPIWNQNKGNIIAAQAGLDQALEQPHRTEVTLTNGVAGAFAAYKTNLDALEYYRRYILPDQVRAYRGVLERRNVDPNAAFADLVTAQQALATGVTTYLTTLGSLWTSVVNLADYLQSDDLFQSGKTMELPPLPDMNCLPKWPCPHPTAAAGIGGTGLTPVQPVHGGPARQITAPHELRPLSLGPTIDAMPIRPVPAAHIQSTAWEVNPGTAKGAAPDRPASLPDPATLGVRPAGLPPKLADSADQ